MFVIHVQSITETEESFMPRLIKGKGKVDQYPDSWDDEDWDDEED